MQFGSYLFKCTLLKEAVFPPYKGSTFRGGFGGALKKVCCTVRGSDCATCLLASRCLYSTTFETTCFTGAANRRMTMPPRPYVIRPPESNATRYEPGDSFDFTLLLFGKTNDLLPYFIYAFETMGKQGLGKKIDGQRATYLLDAVESCGKKIYSSDTQQLTRDLSTISLDLHEPLPPATDGELKLTLTTPLRLKFDNRFQAQLPFSLLVRAMLRRISALFAEYGHGEPKLDYRGLVEQAKRVEVCQDNLSWFDWQRYSNRQEAKMLMGGIIGTVTYQGEIGTYLPLIELAKELHLGKQTAFGLGKIDYQWLPNKQH